MLSSQRRKTLVCLKGIIIIIIPIPNFNHIFPNSNFSLNLKYCTITCSQSHGHGHSFVVSYLINNCGFSPESALKASNQLRFKNSEKPDSVLTFFRNHGFSNSHINSIIRRAPRLLLCNPHKRVLPKFNFLLSKGASTSDIVFMVTRSLSFLHASLDNHIIPTYELVRRFFQSDHKTIDCLVTCPILLAHSCLAQNVNLLLDHGVSHSNITRMFRRRPIVLCSRDLGKAVDEVKEFGIDPLKSKFSAALQARVAIAKPHWDEKVNAFKTWGWSHEAFSDAFRRNPNCMLASKDRINALMSFWVNQLGWNSLVLVRRPELFGCSLEKRTIPRAFVVQYLLSKGLIDKNASLVTPFAMSEKKFLEKYVKSFEEETSHLLKLYQEKMNLQ